MPSGCVKLMDIMYMESACRVSTWEVVVDLENTLIRQCCLADMLTVAVMEVYEHFAAGV